MAGPITYDDYLAHYGIKGMKWGVRRKEGPDGTVSSAVRLRKRKANASGDSKEASDAKKKAKKSGSESLSNKELKTIQERRNLEKNAKVRPKDRTKSSEDAKDAGGIKKVSKKKGTKALSNDELQSVITRMELEQKYAKLTNDNKKSKAGKDFVGGILKDAAANVATSVVEDMMRNAGSAAGNAARKQYDARRNDRRGIPSGQRAIGS